MTRYLTNFTAQAIEDFVTSPDGAPEPVSIPSGPTGETGSAAAAAAGPATPPKAAKQVKAPPPPPAPVASQGEPPPLTMGS